MKKFFKVLCVSLALLLVLSFCGCQALEIIFKQAQIYIEPIINTNISGIYVESANGKSVAFDSTIPGIAFSGEFNRSTGEFTASEIYACIVDGSDKRLYKAVPPHFAADFSNIVYQLDMRKGLLNSLENTGKFSKWEGEYRIKYNDSLSKYNNDVTFKFRSQFFSLAFAARNNPTPQTSFVPKSTKEDVGKPIKNSIIKLENYYARSTLSKNERAFYDDVYDVIFHMKSKIDIGKYVLRIDSVDKIIQYVRNDSPELFWWEQEYTYNYNKDKIVTSLQLQYAYSAKDVQTLQTKIDAEAATILKSIDATMSEYQKFIKIYMEFGKIVEYDSIAYEAITAGKERVDNTDQTIVGGLSERKAVCGGISRSLQYLLYKVGVPCYYVTGTMDTQPGIKPPGNHAWNIIKIEEQWYYADLTQNMRNVKAQVAADYLMTDKECSLARTFTMKDKSGKIYENPVLPKCISERFDRAVRDPAYFKTLDVNSGVRLKNLLYNALQEGQGKFEVSFESKQDAAQAAKTFATQNQSITADIPAFKGMAVFHLYSAVSDKENVVLIWPVYRIT